MCLTRKASFKDTLFVGMHQGEPPPCASGSCFGLYFLLFVSNQTVFLYYMSAKYSLRGIFWFFGVHVTHWLLYHPDEINTIVHSFIGYIYMGAQVNSNTIANICWYKYIQTFKYQCCGFQVHFKSILVYNLKTKSDFWSKCPHYIMNYIKNLRSTFFLLLLVLNLAYIDYSLYQIWSVYMQYFRCCDQSNKCLFLDIQQAEVLLNFFLVSVYTLL